MQVIVIVIDFPELTGNSKSTASNTNSNRLWQDLKYIVIPVVIVIVSK